VLTDDVERIAAVAAAYASAGEELAAVLPVEPTAGQRIYLCAFTSEESAQTWLAFDDAGTPVTSRKHVRDAASIAALVEVAEDNSEAPAELRVASLAYLDALSAGARGNVAAALQSAVPVVDELTKDVEGNYKLELT